MISSEWFCLVRKSRESGKEWLDSQTCSMLAEEASDKGKIADLGCRVVKDEYPVVRVVRIKVEEVL
jgi:hypothetical protein